MGQSKQQTILFLCTGNYYRSRFAEVLFNSVAARMGLPWRASSRGLALERGAGNVGPMAPSAIKALDALGIGAAEACARFPVQAASADLEGAALVIALQQDEHQPLLLERFPLWLDRIEFWQVADAPEALALIEEQVHDLIARLFGGGTRVRAIVPDGPPKQACPKCRQPSGLCTCGAKKDAPQSAAAVKIGRETKGRRGKGVTTIWDIPLDEAGVRELAGKLKERCGTGGTVKERRIEIQGDQRERIAAELEKLGYKVKRVGG